MSKSDTVNECLRKYKRSYIDKAEVKTKALALGSMAHSYQESLLLDKKANAVDLMKKLDADKVEHPELYTMIDSMVNFTNKWCGFCSKNELDFKVETKYALDAALNKCQFFDKKVYIRGVIDLHTYNPKEKILHIVDHKSNKSVMSEKQVLESSQLKLYAMMLTKIHKYDVELIQAGINLLRHDKLVTVLLTPSDIAEFEVAFLGYLDRLDDKLDECEETGEYPANPGYYCSWCSFKEECLADGTLEDKKKTASK